MAFLSPLGSPIRGSAYRNRTANRARGRGEQNPWTPALLAPYAWGDVHIGGTSSTVSDSSGNGRSAASYGALTASPQFLPYTGTAYVYLEAAAAGTNSVACTAPANTASYSASPLGGGAASTGAASAGAFSFTTAGSWQRLDLLDGSANVLASFRPADSGQSGYTDSYSVAWAITRGTAGGKSVLVQSRSVALLRTDDFIDVPLSWVPPMTASDRWSFVVVGRMHATPKSFCRVFSTKGSTGGSSVAGIDVITDGTAFELYSNLGDGTSSVLTNSANQTFSSGVRFVHSVCTDGSVMKTSTNGAARFSSASIAGLGNRTGAGSVLIGARNGPGNFQDFEFEALLTFDYELNVTQLAKIDAYYRAGT